MLRSFDGGCMKETGVPRLVMKGSAKLPNAAREALAIDWWSASIYRQNSPDCAFLGICLAPSRKVLGPRKCAQLPRAFRQCDSSLSDGLIAVNWLNPLLISILPVVLIRVQHSNPTVGSKSNTPRPSDFDQLQSRISSWFRRRREELIDFNTSSFQRPFDGRTLIWAASY